MEEAYEAVINKAHKIIKGELRRTEKEKTDDET